MPGGQDAVGRNLGDVVEVAVDLLPLVVWMLRGVHAVGIIALPLHIAKFLRRLEAERSADTDSAGFDVEGPVAAAADSREVQRMVRGIDVDAVEGLLVRGSLGLVRELASPRRRTVAEVGVVGCVARLRDVP